MLYGIYLLVFLLSVLFSWLLIPRILVLAFRKRLFDEPDERKVHCQSIPRLGGLSFVPTILFSLSFVSGLCFRFGWQLSPAGSAGVVQEFLMLICGLTLLYLAGIKDDLVGLRYHTKFVLQFVAASFLPISGLWIHDFHGFFGLQALTPWMGVPLTLFVVVFIINAINLIDGIDGLASGLSCIALGLSGYLFVSAGLACYAMLAFSTLGVLLPFFYYNVFGRPEHCRKIFMGDTGSLTLGYILAFLTLRYAVCAPPALSCRAGALLIAFSALLVPLFDVVRVMGVRIRHGRHLFHPDKNHIHHKFLAMGLTHSKATLSIVGVSCGFSLLNLVGISYVDVHLLLLADILLWIGLNLWFDRLKKQV